MSTEIMMALDSAGVERLAVLIIETTTSQGSVAWVGRDGTLEQRLFRSDRSHNSALFPPLRELIGARASELGLVLVGSGPGSYSGTRVGIAAAQGVALVASCPCVAIPSVFGASPPMPGPRLVVGDARRGAWWWMHLEGGRVLSGPELADREAFSERLGQSASRGIPVFSMEDPDGLPVPRDLPRPDHFTPTASGLYAVWRAAGAEERALWASASPQPVYLRPPHITRPTKTRAWESS